MKMKFESIAGEVEASFAGGKWSVVEGEPRAIEDVINADSQALETGQHFITPWDRVDRVCSILGGMMLEPRPVTDVEDVEDSVF